jgi:hypothetical protein
MAVRSDALKFFALAAIALSAGCNTQPWRLCDLSKVYLAKEPRAVHRRGFGPDAAVPICVRVHAGQMRFFTSPFGAANPPVDAVMDGSRHPFHREPLEVEDEVFLGTSLMLTLKAKDCDKEPCPRDDVQPGSQELKAVYACSASAKTSADLVPSGRCVGVDPR